jgi:HK97 family phage portal protein
MAPNLIVLSVNRAPSDTTGVGPMESPRIEGLIAEQLYSQEYFQNNGNPTGVLDVPGLLTKDEADVLKRQWVAGHATRAPAVVSGGMTWEPLSFNPNDSEWTETHMVGIGDVATLFGVPSVLLNYNAPGSSLTYQAIDDVNEQWWRNSLNPTYAERIEQAWARATGTVVAFDPAELFIASLRERADAAGVLVRSGYEPADVSQVVGLPDMGHTGIISVSLQPPEGA